MVEHESLRVDSQHQVETGKSSEDVHVTREIHDCVEVNVEEPSQFSKIIEKSPHHELIEDKSLLGDVH
ncbi:hypothetical protein PVK06_027295 [Gossypium arboreum]|uniref:Uncharacterized protein n=1 Tax=Gossypium arboreum TaxID=29729 RepID=A0ABR0NZW4_GOSAR|nr:hypothetical protein PVK06_027295 [Gossypium arboreum]